MGGRDNNLTGMRDWIMIKQVVEHWIRIHCVGDLTCRRQWDYEGGHNGRRGRYKTIQV